MGLTGEALGEKSTGILTAIIGAFSVTVWGFAAYSFRPYAFLLLFSALSLYCHIRKNQTGGERGWLIKYSAVVDEPLLWNDRMCTAVCLGFFAADKEEDSQKDAFILYCPRSGDFNMAEFGLLENAAL